MSQLLILPIIPPTILAGAVLGTLAMLVLAIDLTQTEFPGTSPAAFGIALLAYPALRLDLADPDIKAEVQR